MKKKQFLLKFIKSFYTKARTNRRSTQNTFSKVYFTINSVSRTFFSKKLQFTEKEIIAAFEMAGFTIMGVTEADFSWERLHDNHFLMFESAFINIIPQCNKDLNLSKRRSYPEKFKEETIEKLFSLKLKLKKFWKNNKHFME